MARRRRRHNTAQVGNFMADWWPHVYDYSTKTYTYTPPKPEYRERLVKLCTTTEPHSDPWYRAQGHVESTWEVLDSKQILDANMTVKNASSASRKEQAFELEEAGYHGPIGGGEARALRNLFAELGMPDLVKRGWVKRNVQVTLPPTKYQIRRAAWANNPIPPGRLVWNTRLQNCYLFKSPLENVPFEKWIKLARLYKDGKALRDAVVALMGNPEAHKEIETLDALEILGGMKGME